MAKGLIAGILLSATLGAVGTTALAVNNEDFRNFTKINQNELSIIQEQDQTIKDTREEMQAIELARQTLLTEKTDLENTLASINSELETTKTNLANKEAELISVQNQLNTVSSTLSEKESLLEQKQTELENAIANGELQSEQIANKETEIANLQSEINSLSDRVTSLTNQKEVLMTARNNAQQQVYALTAELEQANARIEELENSASENSEYYCTSTISGASLKINGIAISWSSYGPSPINISVSDVILPMLTHTVNEYEISEGLNIFIYKRFDECLGVYPGQCRYTANALASNIKFVDENGNELTSADVSDYVTFMAYICEYDSSYDVNEGCYKINATIQLTDGVLKTSGGDNANIDWGNE